MLFPNLEDFVDFLGIYFFLAENPTPALLADMYYSFHLGHEKKKGVIICSTPLLHAHLMSHIPQESAFSSDHIYYMWSQKISSLTSNSISCYSWDHEVDGVIFSCSDFPNVPLMGSHGCINYNPILDLR